jgi:ferrous iron transport protein B
VSLLAGVGAKEIVASTIGVLGGLDSLSPLVAYSYLLFVLLYFPCIATIAAIRHETGSWRWAVFAAVYTTCLAWLVSAAVSRFGGLLSGC